MDVDTALTVNVSDGAVGGGEVAAGAGEVKDNVDKVEEEVRFYYGVLYSRGMGRGVKPMDVDTALTVNISDGAVGGGEVAAGAGEAKANVEKVEEEVRFFYMMYIKWGFICNREGK